MGGRNEFTCRQTQNTYQETSVHSETENHFFGQKSSVKHQRLVAPSWGGALGTVSRTENLGSWLDQSLDFSYQLGADKLRPKNS